MVAKERIIRTLILPAVLVFLYTALTFYSIGRPSPDTPIITDDESIGVPLASSCYSQVYQKQGTCGKPLPSMHDPISSCRAFRDEVSHGATEEYLQKVHFRQALAEECWEDDDVQLDHEHARGINANGCAVGVIFPRSLVGYCACGVWNSQKTISYSFSGARSPERVESFLMDYLHAEGASVVFTNVGRDIRKETGKYDYPYYDRLMESKFVLAPDGEFAWTYRFLEGIMCGAIPIIEHRDTPEEQELGYHYCEAGHPCIYIDDDALREKAARQNWIRFLRRHSLVMEEISLPS